MSRLTGESGRGGCPGPCLVGFDYLKGPRCHNFSTQTVQVIDCSHCGKKPKTNRTKSQYQKPSERLDWISCDSVCAHCVLSCHWEEPESIHFFLCHQVFLEISKILQELSLLQTKHFQLSQCLVIWQVFQSLFFGALCWRYSGASVGLVLGKLRPGPKRSRCILTLPVLSRWEGSPSSTCCCCFSWCHPGCHLLSLLCRWVAGELATSCSACGPQMLLCGAVFQPTGPSMCWCLFIHKGSTSLFWTYQDSCQPICPAFPGSSEWQLGLPAAPSSVVSSAKLLKMCPAAWSRWCQYWLPYWPLGDTAGDWPPDGLWSSDHSSWLHSCLSNPPHCPLT